MFAGFILDTIPLNYQSSHTKKTCPKMPVEIVLWECSKYLMANILVFIGNQRMIKSRNWYPCIQVTIKVAIVRSTDVLEP